MCVCVCVYIYIYIYFIYIHIYIYIYIYIIYKTEFDSLVDAASSGGHVCDLRFEENQRSSQQPVFSLTFFFLHYFLY